MNADRELPFTYAIAANMIDAPFARRQEISLLRGASKADTRHERARHAPVQTCIVPVAQASREFPGLLDHPQQRWRVDTLGDKHRPSAVNPGSAVGRTFTKGRCDVDELMQSGGCQVACQVMRGLKRRGRNWKAGHALFDPPHRQAHRTAEKIHAIQESLQEVSRGFVGNIVRTK
jgi:hypothetical protein